MLSTYITQVQRLLHDTTASYWSVSELTDYINEARNRICSDSWCLRQTIPGIALTAQQELYTPQTLLTPVAGRVVGTAGITFYISATERYELNYLPFRTFTARFRRYVTYYQRSTCWSRQGMVYVYLGPNPDQPYITDWDVAITPLPLATDADPEPIPVPAQEPIQYWAASKAKWKEQAQGEAQIFETQYLKLAGWCARAFMPWIQPNAYTRGR